MIKVILWDIDGTLLNFKAAEKNAIHKGFERYNLGLCTEEMLARYSAINRTYWERLERGEISKQEVLLGRFREFFAQEGLPVEQAAHFNESYQLDLGETCIFCDNGKELVKELKELGYRQYAVTNGTRTAQRKKLVRSGLGEMRDGAFI